jgi:hypothetical protein
LQGSEFFVSKTPIIVTPEALLASPEGGDMWKDPIVEEIHAIREQIAQECDYDIKQIVARLRKYEKDHSHRLVYQTQPKIATQLGDTGLPERE